jgi:hypothetical protein
VYLGEVEPDCCVVKEVNPAMGKYILDSVVVAGLGKWRKIG